MLHSANNTIQNRIGALIVISPDARASVRVRLTVESGVHSLGALARKSPGVLPGTGPLLHDAKGST